MKCNREGENVREKDDKKKRRKCKKKEEEEEKKKKCHVIINSMTKITHLKHINSSCANIFQNIKTENCKL